MFIFYSPLFWILALPGLVLGLFAQSRVKGAFNKYSKVRTHRNVTGAEVARTLLDAQGLYDVSIERTQGNLSDHYDPRSKVLRLSPAVHDQPSVAAAGVAAHEMGHALQDAGGYAALNLRSALVPAANLGSSLAPMIFMVGLFMDVLIKGTGLGYYISLLGVGLFGLAVLFTLITLPVEFDASKRALVWLEQSGTTTTAEHEGAKDALKWAAMTYVSAALSSIKIKNAWNKKNKIL